MAFGFSDLTPAGKRYFAELKKLAESEIQVGFQSDQTYEDGTSLAEIAAINELGSSDTPARPFMRQSFENHEAELQAACDRANAILSNGGTAEQALNQLGVFCRGLVQEEIVEGALRRTQSRPSRRRGRSNRLSTPAT